MRQYEWQWASDLASIYVSHTLVDAAPWSTPCGPHSFVCKHAPGRTTRHHALNDVIFRAFSSADIPATNKPVGLTRLDGKRPDGLTLVPWCAGKPLTWDVTAVSTLAGLLCGNRRRGRLGLQLQSYPKIFELCVLDRYSDYFGTSDHHFGFKKHTSCSHVVYSERNVIDHYVSNGGSALLDLSKAFDRMNHYVLFTKQFERNLPLKLLHLLEKWFTMSETCVRSILVIL